MERTWRVFSFGFLGTHITEDFHGHTEGTASFRKKKKVCFLRTDEIKSASKPSGVFLPLHHWKYPHSILTRYPNGSAADNKALHKRFPARSRLLLKTHKGHAARRRKYAGSPKDAHQLFERPTFIKARVTRSDPSSHWTQLWRLTRSHNILKCYVRYLRGEGGFPVVLTAENSIRPKT